jgi:predicted amidohydrolase YtcJ
MEISSKIVERPWIGWIDMTKKLAMFLLLGLLTLSPYGVAHDQQAPDLILFNGKVFTSDSAHPYVEALAIGGDRIVATGDSGKIRALAGPHTKQIDLTGRAVIPGINDAHMHIELEPASTVSLDLKNPNPSWAEVKDAIAAAVLKSPKGTIIFGEISFAIYFDPTITRDSLDQLTPDDPVILAAATGHAAILNSAALAKFGILDNQKDPVGGRYERSPDGRLTGVLREYAVLQMTRTRANLASETDALAELRDYFSGAVKFGITSIQDMSNAMSPDRCVTLLQKTPTPIRVRVMRMPMTTPGGRDTLEGRSTTRDPAPLITVSGTKWMLDGTPLEGTLATLQAQKALVATDVNLAWSKLALTFPEKEMEAMLLESLKNNDQLMVHVSGYPSASAMLDAMAATGGKGVWASRRVRFEHVDGLFPDLVPHAKELGVVVIQNPAHFAVGLNIAQAQPLKSLLAAGIPVGLGSDGPMNPYLNIMLASTHPNRTSEAITREQAVIAYTLTSAYAEFAEKDKGSLEPGKLADLAVLSQDIFSVPTAELPKTQSVLTLVGGKAVYDAGLLH